MVVAGETGSTAAAYGSGQADMGNVAGKAPGNDYVRRGRRRTKAETTKIEQPHLYPSVLNNPYLALGSNFGGQDGDRSYPIHYSYGRYNAGVGRMHDTRDFVNHCFDGRTNDYVPRAVPDPSTVGHFRMAMGARRPTNPNGTVNAFNPPYIAHGLPPLQDSSYYFIQS